MPPLSQLVRMVTIGLLGISACTRHSPAPMLADQLPACCQSRYLPVSFPTTSTAQLAAEYKRLKRRKCSAYARFGSDFYQLLRVLGERLDGQPCPMLQQTGCGGTRSSTTGAGSMTTSTSDSRPSNVYTVLGITPTSKPQSDRYG